MGCNAFHLACVKGDLNIVKAIATKGSVDINATNQVSGFLRN